MTRDEILQKKTLGTITNQKKVCQMAHFPFECPDYKAIKRNLFIFSISQDSLDLLYKELIFWGSLKIRISSGSYIFLYLSPITKVTKKWHVSM